MCVLDGVQVGGDVSFGRGNITLTYMPELHAVPDSGMSAAAPESDWPVMIARARAADGKILRTLRYTPKSELMTLLREGSLGSLQDDARSIVPKQAEELFEVSALADGVNQSGQ